MPDGYPKKCRHCGARDLDIQVIAWLSVSDGKSNEHVIRDAGFEDFRGALARCPTCHDEWIWENGDA